MRSLPLHFALWFSLITALTHRSFAEVRTLWQTLHDYTTIVEPAHDGRQDRHQVNPFLSYTNIGTDFGFLGPAEEKIGWQSGQIGVTLGTSLDDWAGMWHSLSRLARMKGSHMDFSACYPDAIEEPFQPKINGIRIWIRGKGSLKLELADESGRVQWSQSRSLDHDQMSEQIYDLPSDSLKHVKFLNWVAEPGGDFDIDRIDLRVITPNIDFDQWVFLASYAKALTCWSESTGTVRDRAHIDDGSFDSVSATGLFCLATAAAAKEGIVSRDFAIAVLKKSTAVMNTLRGPYGLLPHFIRKNAEGRLEIHPGTEYSTIDTSLFDLSAIISAKMLGEESSCAQAIQDAKQVKMHELIIDQKYISHGVMHDGKTIIPFHWRDWGGESALVLLMLKLTHPQANASMAKEARPHQGTGFIAEIQSLLFPDFDQARHDAISGANWRKVRETLLKDQQEYLQKNQIPSELPLLGIYGFSAGEQRHGMGYVVGGVDLPQQTLIHPHYMLMASSLENDPTKIRAALQAMEQRRLFGAWGLVENIHATDMKSLPMLGSLNATFEALGAYHFSIKHRKKSNEIYQATNQIEELRNAMRAFYP
jgi:hypothetical protein